MEKENIQYACRTRDGELHDLNVRGADNLTEAVFEVAAGLMKNGIIELDGKDYKAGDIVCYLDTPG